MIIEGRSFGDFLKNYNPILNPFKINPKFNNIYLFNIDGDDFEEVKRHKYDHVWTLTKLGRKLIIYPGLIQYREVGYFVSDYRWLNKFFEYKYEKKDSELRAEDYFY